jgi:hypothetical protein
MEGVGFFFRIATSITGLEPTLQSMEATFQKELQSGKITRVFELYLVPRMPSENELVYRAIWKQKQTPVILRSSSGGMN